MTDAPTPRRGGGRRLTGTTRTRCAALAAAATLCVLFAVASGAAYAQTTPAQTTTTTQTTPTETTPTTTETTPPPETTDPTSAPNEYVESVPTGGGSAPAPQNPAPAPAAPVTPTGGVTQSTQSTTGAGETTSTPKVHRKIRRSADLGDPVHMTSSPQAQAPRSVAVTPASADPGEPPSPFLLGIALLLITGVVLSTAVARRQSAGT